MQFKNWRNIFELNDILCSLGLLIRSDSHCHIFHHFLILHYAFVISINNHIRSLEAIQHMRFLIILTDKHNRTIIRLFYS